MNTHRRFLMKAQNKTMKTIITSNWRPPHRALFTLLLGIAALWAMPRSARAQVLYVSLNGANIVGEYDATSGAAINANLITGLNLPRGLALSGNNLLVSNVGGTTVGEYNATTGAVINATLIAPSEPHGLALSGNNLFVLGSTPFVGDAMVGEYDATTGATINATLIPGLAQGAFPNGLAVASVPEPSPWSMIAVGGVALLGIILRKRPRSA